MDKEPTAAALWDRLPASSRALCLAVARAAAARGEAVYLVGGCVRDLLLGHSQVDLDVVVEGDAVALAAAVAEQLGATTRTPSEFMTTALELPSGGHLDLTTARQETYPAPANLPEVAPASIAEDLRRRDFSVNALAVRVETAGATELIDLSGGRQDLAAGLIRILHPGSFADDPTRIIRAVRFEQRLGFALEPATEAALRQTLTQGLLEQVSGPRVRDELVKLLQEPQALRMLRRLQELGALGRALPHVGLDRESQRWLESTPVALTALRIGGRQWPFLLGALCARGDAATALERLHPDAAARVVVEAMAQAARGPLPRFLTSRGPVLDSRLAEALEPCANGERVVYWLRGCAIARQRLERDAGTLRPTRADISGDDLLTAAIPPGPEIGVGLRAARAAKLDRGADEEEQLRVALAAARDRQAPERRRRVRPDVNGA